MHLRTFSLLVLVLGLSETTLPGAWSDRTAGLPPVETISAKNLGLEGTIMTLAQDKLGRIYVGANSLLVFDGQAWLAFSKPNAYPISSMAMGEDGKLWVGTTNDLGYFQEEILGVFKFHSLHEYLPKEFRDVGIIWGCAPIGTLTYFICKDKIITWNGQNTQITPFETKLRLCPMKMGSEWWFFHFETGLYRLTPNGPKLEVPSSQLTGLGVMGLFRDESGIVTVSNSGLVRPGNPPKLISQLELNKYLTKHAVSAFQELPDGNLLIGTVSGGIVLASRAGHIIRAWDSNSGLPGQGICSLGVDPTGEVLGTTPTSFFHLTALGECTVFTPDNGFTGATINSLQVWNSTVCAITDEGVFRQIQAINGTTSFQLIPELGGVYRHALPHRNGLLLSRFGGVDWFDGKTLRPTYSVQIDLACLSIPMRADPSAFYVSETYGLSKLYENLDGTFERTRFLDLPDTCTSLYEDLAGTLWIGTVTKGAFKYNPATKTLSAINNPVTDEMLPGQVSVLGNSQRILVIFKGGILQFNPENQTECSLANIPSFTLQDFCTAPNGQDVLVAYQHQLGANLLSGGVGIISFDYLKKAKWEELDIPTLDVIGPVRSLTISEEDHRPILWLGGTEGILRVDYEKIRPLGPPTAPIIKSDDSLAVVSREKADHPFPFKDHHVHLMVFTGDYVRGKNWLIQTRLDGSEWSSAAPRRSFEYTNLSEGKYRFEARAVNSAGMASEPAALEFTILPPWYRSSGAYTGYAAGLACGVFGFIRLRERRIYRRNLELETLVASRTEELVKANAAKDEFLASVSHEIRNPMNGVIGIAESFKTEGLDPESRHKFNLLLQCASHLSSLLEDLLDFSRVQAGAVELESKSFDLAGLMDSVTALTSAESEKRGIPVEIAISPSVPPQLTGDQRRIRQILLNFVNNALNFSGQGQVSVTVWCKSAGPRRTEIFFAVSDEGPGIAPQEQEKLFTRFERGTAAKQGRVPGTGLGLALCRTLAEQMGGRIWLESELGAGSCFYFSAPFETAGPDTPPPSPLPLGGNLRSALVVDDEEYNRIALADLLELLGFGVQTAADGPQALALAENNAFDAIFLDCAMPGLSGLDVARAVRALPNRSAQALVFAVTAFNTPDKRAQCIAAGMDGFLGKPITMERLRQALAATSAHEKPAAGSSPEEIETKDPYAKLRVLATRKQISLSEEVFLFLSELEEEVAQLIAALQHEAARESDHYAHLLCGRAGFISERELELILRKISRAAANSQWAEARSLGREVQNRAADLRVRLGSAAPAAPHA